MDLLFILTTILTCDTVRMLCISNNFSWDAVEQELVPLCQTDNQAIIIGNLYYGGHLGEQYHTFLIRDTAAFSFRHIKHSIHTLNEGYSLRQAQHFMDGTASLCIKRSIIAVFYHPFLVIYDKVAWNHVLFTSKYDVNNSFWHVALLKYIASGK